MGDEGDKLAAILTQEDERGHVFQKNGTQIVTPLNCVWTYEICWNRFFEKDFLTTSKSKYLLCFNVVPKMVGDMSNIPALWAWPFLPPFVSICLCRFF